jgi:diguanylate cyclase (GGDEF)-like protein
MGRSTIVCVDDERSVIVSLRDQLSRILGQDYDIELAESAQEALELFQELQLEQIEVALVLCDQTMPDMSGVELLCQLHHLYPKTLKILLTGLASLNDIVKAVNHANLYRYMTKPWDETDLGLTVKEALRRYEHEQQLAAQNLALQQVNVELQREISDRLRAEAQLAHDALHDALTGLPNRALFLRRLEQTLRTCKNQPDYQFAVLFIDLDRFKIINDSLGHMVGDQLLIKITQRLLHCLRSQDLVSRLGGDEFTILLENIRDPAEAVHVAERILASLCQRLHLEGHNLFPSASIGIVIGSQTYQHATDLLRDADAAMYEAKKTGRSCYALFTHDLHTHTVKVLQLESDLRQALSQKEFRLHYQPIISLTTNQLIGFEALVRWQHPQRGFVSPNDFIALAEETGFIIPLGEWVLYEACRQMHTWHQQFPAYSTLLISVNLSSKQLRDPRFIASVDRILAETGLEGQFLKLELTESMLVDDVETVIQTLENICAKNIQLSIDDFGTGYSSLSYLPRFPVNMLKIDRSFVNQMIDDPENLEIVRAIVTLARSMDLEVVAEGIETPQQLKALKELGCGFGQGYLFSRPVDDQTVVQEKITRCYAHIGC